MQKSTVYHVMVKPNLIFGLPVDYAVLAFCLSILVGGYGGMFMMGNGLGVFLGTAPFALIFWVIGFFMTKKDPEFMGVWIKNCFNIGSYVRLDGKREYEP